MKNLPRFLTCFFLLLNFISFKSFAQTPEWIWAKSIGGKYTDKVNSISADNNGNIYVTGSFRSDSLVFGTTTIRNASTGDEDMFVAKYDAHGIALWGNSIGGIYTETGLGIVNDRYGNTYVTGTFGSPKITIGATTLEKNPYGLSDVFLAKYDSAGNLLWAKSAGGTSIGVAITIDNEDNVYITGTFSDSTATFDSTVIRNSATTKNTPEIYLAKYSPDGGVIWAKSLQGVSSDWSTDITFDINGYIILTGYFYSSTLTLGNTVINNITPIPNPLSTDVFIAKYDLDGNNIWAKSAGGESAEISSSVVTDNNGNIFVTGDFRSSAIILGTTTLNNSHPANPTQNMFISKYDANGNNQWAQSSIATSKDITIDNEGYIYLTGRFQGSITKFGDFPLKESHDFNGFLVKYDPEGVALMAYGFGGYSEDQGSSIIADPDGVIYMGGYFWYSSSFGSNTLDGASDGFLTKVDARSILSTSINEIVNTGKFQISPNPTTSQFHITNLSPGNWTITIYTLDGQPVFKKEITEANAMIDLSGKAKGAYVYRLLKDGVVFKTGKIVLE